MSILNKSNHELELFKEGVLSKSIGTALSAIKNNKALTAGVATLGVGGNVARNKIGDKIRLHRAGGTDEKIRNPIIDCLAVGEKGTRSYNRCVAAAYSQKGSGDTKKKIDRIEDKIRNGAKDKELARLKAAKKEASRQYRNQQLKKFARLATINGALNVGAAALGSDSSFMYYDNK
jgi:hypothetical protein